MNQEIQQYLDYIKANYSQWQCLSKEPLDEIRIRIRAEMNEKFIASVRAEVGSKYIKVITGSSVHSFIVKEDGSKFKKGDILKAASWAAPAKNFSRGNILSKEYGVISWTGA